MNKQQIRREIALWIIRLDCDDPQERAKIQQQFEDWKKSHPEHLHYFEELNLFNEEIQKISQKHALKSQTVKQTFQAVEQDKLHILSLFKKTILAITAVSFSAYIFYSYFPMQYYTADYKTGIAETRSFTLSDGSKITLSAKSAIKLDFSATQRRIELIQGDLYIDVAKDTGRPLIVQTPQANFKALGTQFIVNRYPTSSTLSMLHSKVQVTTNQALQPHSEVVSEGEKIQVNQQGLGKIETINPVSIQMAWQKHQIVADELPLSDLLTRLNAYYNRYIIFDHSRLSHIKVTGVINTNQDLDATLRLLKTQYPEIDFVQVGNFVTYAKVRTNP
ncbi:DUF4974 domain-containing protein [Acinetobacter qingfengensis]|nr:FecR domain-containing protein [Acinetobacter qingfengensis]KAA8730828.1 DUF4974 domain-containing protein [Acinetobacter qingfengensis]